MYNPRQLTKKNPENVTSILEINGVYLFIGI
jgi:hypothetical protein